MINVLDSATINKIAAGEVIERPCAVVKELVENAIDAKASSITIEIKEGGISFIRVTDNGVGIPAKEISTAFLRHATSKIKSTEDLLTVTSLGFRGEALASIAAVSSVEVITKQEEDITGVRYEIDGGIEKGKTEVGCPSGTTFIMRNLFYNVPARRKFLKSKTTEGNYIYDLVQKYSLAHPEIRFTFIADGKNKIQTSGDENLKTNIFYNFGSDVAKNIMPVSYEEHDMTLSGYIGRPEFSRANRMYMLYFVNGRYIKSPIIIQAIEEAYKPYLMSHRHPFVVLNMTIPSDCIDVNVHPTKMEVRFTNQQDVYEMFLHSVRNCLEQATLIPEVSLEHNDKPVMTKPAVTSTHIEPFEAKREQTSPVTPPTPAYPVSSPDMSAGNFVRESTRFPQKNEKVFIQKNLVEEQLIQEDVPQFRIIGQVFDTYWMIEYENQLLIIDQHAAHEKVLYEKIMKHLKEKEGISQSLLSPVVVTLSGKEMQILEQYQETFEYMGFRIEPFGDKEYIISAIPADFLNLQYKELFLELLDNLMINEKSAQPDYVLDHCATMACKAAVKGNHTMSFSEAKSLIEQMLQLDQPYHCPHGRPTTITMTKQEFEKKFKRIV